MAVKTSLVASSCFFFCHCKWGKASLAIRSTMFIQRMCLGGLGVGSLWTEKRAGRKRGERGEERSRFQQFSSPPTDVSRWPGERGPLTEGQRDTCEWQNLTLTNAQKHTYIHIHTHTHTHTHTAVQCIVRLSSAVSSQRWWNVWLSASRALETWCHSNKMPSFQRETAFYVFRATQWKERGKARTETWERRRD